MKQPLLPLFGGLITTSKRDPTCLALADRHYPRQTKGATQFMGPGRTLVLRDEPGTIVFGWQYQRPEFRNDSIDGWCCTIFRNESARLSSDVILEAERMVVASWGPKLAFTYVAPESVSSGNPGYCFKVAGWRKVGLSKKRGRHLLTKELAVEERRNPLEVEHEEAREKATRPHHARLGGGAGGGTEEVRPRP